MKKLLKYYAMAMVPALLWLFTGVYSSVAAQAYFYTDIDPYSIDSYSYGGNPSYRQDPYYGYSPQYGYFNPRHVGPHKGFHVTPDAGLHWGRHYGDHRIGSRRAHGHGVFGWY